MNKKNILLIFGFGYTAKFLCKKLSGKNWEVYCTTRGREKINEIKSINASPVLFNDAEKIESIFSEDLYVLSTVPPVSGKDPVIENYGTVFKKNSNRIKWSSYTFMRRIFLRTRITTKFYFMGIFYTMAASTYSKPSFNF